MVIKSSLRYHMLRTCTQILSCFFAWCCYAFCDVCRVLTFLYYEFKFRPFQL